jgi:putative oxidoreductase
MFETKGLAGPVLLAARLMIAGEFVLWGTMKIINTERMQAYMEARGVPGALIWGAILLQIGGGLLIAGGLYTRWAALALAGFCLVATGIFHSNFADLGELSDFTKDIATAGGLLILALVGPGPWSLDAARRRTA